MLSPLLSNLYMRRFLLGWEVLGHGKRLGAVVVNYADDFVICTRKNAQAALDAMRGMMSKLGLTVNAAKTRTCDARRESFEFLGYRFGPCHSAKTGKPYTGAEPSKRKVAALCREVSFQTRKQTTGRSGAEQVELLNRKLRGWQGYFRLGAVSGAYAVVMKHVRKRLGGWLRGKEGELRGEASRHPKEFWHGTMNLVDLMRLPRGSLWANAPPKGP